MPRVAAADPMQTEKRIARILQAQAETWGAPLANHLVYARRPSIFRGVRGMWSALEESGLLDPRLVALLNRRVASLNGCPF